MSNSTKENVPPQSLDVERSVLASMLIDSNLCKEGVDKLKDIDFYSTAHKIIFNAMLCLVTEEMDVNIVTAVEQLRKSGDIERVGGETYIAFLTDDVSTVSDLSSYIKILKKKSTARELITAASKLQNACFIPDSNIDIALKFFEGKLERIRQSYKSDAPAKAEIIKAKSIKSKVDGFREFGFKFKGVDVGFPGVANCWRPDKSFLHLISGIPQHGKSLFVDILIANTIKKHGWHWVVYSPESHPIELHISNIMHAIFRKSIRDMSDSEYDANYNYFDEHVHFLHPDLLDPSSVEYINATKQFKQAGNRVDAVILDPLNCVRLVPDPDEKGLVHKIGHNLRLFRSFARHEFLAFFVVAHPAKMYKEKSGRYKGKYAPPVGYDVFGGSPPLNTIDTGITIYRDFDNGSSMLKVWKIRFQQMHGQPNEERYMMFDKQNYQFVPYAEAKEGAVQGNWVDDAF